MLTCKVIIRQPASVSATGSEVMMEFGKYCTYSLLELGKVTGNEAILWIDPSALNPPWCYLRRK